MICTVSRPDSGPSSAIADPRDCDAIDRVVTAVLLAEPSLILSAAAHPVDAVADRDLRLIRQAITAAGPPDWDADGVYRRVCYLLHRHPSALELAIRLREIGRGIGDRPVLLDRAVAAASGDCTDATRESVTARARLLCDPDDGDVPDLLRRLQAATA